MRAWVLLVVMVGCKKKAPAIVVEDDVVNDVEVAIQVVTVSPSTIGVGRPASVLVVGSGFVSGASVRVGDTPCTSTFRNANQLEVTIPSMPAGAYDVSVVNPDMAESTLRSGLSVRSTDAMVINLDACRRATVYFDSDQATLSAAVQGELTALVPCLLSAETPVRLQGHADERGTTDYNLALGQRRAQSVQDHLVVGGVARARLPVLTFGEEMPASSGWGEAAWAKNRRVDLVAD